MYYVYTLRHPQTLFLYVGYTNDLIRRCKQHGHDKPGWRLAYYEAYAAEQDARLRERQLKQYGSSLGHLRKRLSYSLRSL